MIEKIEVLHYRKLQDLSLEFCSTVNLISGPNGTCKSSLLHMISNAFQEVKSGSGTLKDKKCIPTLRGINSLLNPKIESLVKGDKKYQDPAHGVKGTLFSVRYVNGSTISFRRHNSKTSPQTMRYAIKPSYTKGTKDKLPELPVIYLGLSRLYPYGEFQNDGGIEKVRYHLPDCYQDEVIRLYSELAHIEISNLKSLRLKGLKSHTDFDSTKVGVDANTISSGEENLLTIIKALVSLKYYFECLTDSDLSNRHGGILLIDEVDAALHPSMQERLFDTMIEYCTNYNIQLISTTHSISLLDYAFRKKQNVIYLHDDIEKVQFLKDPDIYKIRMRLRSLTRRDIYEAKCIPVFTEDEEARKLLKETLTFIATKDHCFAQMIPYLHLVETKMGAEALRGMFSDSMIHSTAGQFCVLDGDHQTELHINIVALPGKDSPEKFIYKYAHELFESGVSDFWDAQTVQDGGYTRVHFRDTVKHEYDTIIKESENQTGKKKLRESLKSFYLNNLDFFALVYRHWLNDPQNRGELDEFKKNLSIMFKKTAPYHSLNPAMIDCHFKGA